MKYYYTYRIDFKDGSYYYGSRVSNVPPEKDANYNGSPVTYKHKWETEKYKKTIIESFSSYEEMMDAESLLINDNFKEDIKCLNCHNTKSFHNYNLKAYYKNNNGNIIIQYYPKDFNPGGEWIEGRPKGHKASKEHKQKISKSLKGRKFSNIHKKNLSKAKKESSYLMKGDKNVMAIPEIREKHYNILQTKEYREKVSRGVRNSNRWTPEKKEEHRKRQRDRLKKNNPSSKPVVIDGVFYASIQDAITNTGFTRNYIKKNYLTK